MWQFSTRIVSIGHKLQYETIKRGTVKEINNLQRKSIFITQFTQMHKPKIEPVILSLRTRHYISKAHKADTDPIKDKLLWLKHILYSIPPTTLSCPLIEPCNAIIQRNLQKKEGRRNDQTLFYAYVKEIKLGFTKQINCEQAGIILQSSSGENIFHHRLTLDLLSPTKLDFKISF